MVKIIYAKEKFDCEHLIGAFGELTDFDILIEEDTDCYMPIIGLGQTNSEENIAFKFRKNFFSKESQDSAYEGLRDAAKESDNRGLAAGPLDLELSSFIFLTEEEQELFDYFINPIEENIFDSGTDVNKLITKCKESRTVRNRAFTWMKNKIVGFDFLGWANSLSLMDKETQMKEATKVFTTKVAKSGRANRVFSGIAGWYDRYPRIPYGRATAYTESSFDKFQLSFPFLQELDSAFSDLLPNRYHAQTVAAAKIDPGFIVPGTVFSTITVNKTFRTAYHRDASDFTKGMSNLLVLSNDSNFSGGYLIFPEYKIAVNVRPGDLLLVNNHEIIHGNTPIELGSETSERVSLVCYLREGMLSLGEKEYEDIRKAFVYKRQHDKSHPENRPLWNGISPGMWGDSDDSEGNKNSIEWKNYLLAHKKGEYFIEKYHPWLNSVNETCDIEEFFG